MQKGRRGLLAEQTHEQIDENLRTHGLLCNGGCQLDWLNNGGIVILGLLTRVEIGHIRIGSAGNGRIRSRGSASSLSQRT